MQIKRTLTFFDETAFEAGQVVDPPLRKVAVAAIIDNPFAGRFERDLSSLTKASEEIGRTICRLAVSMLAPHKPVSYGKAAIIGINGEQEHGVAMLTTVFGNVMRDAAGWLWFEMGLAADLSGAAALAALRQGRVTYAEGERVCAIVCGAGPDALLAPAAQG